jgi:hypothetical protein
MTTGGVSTPAAAASPALIDLRGDGRAVGYGRPRVGIWRRDGGVRVAVKTSALARVVAPRVVSAAPSALLARTSAARGKRARR